MTTHTPFEMPNQAHIDRTIAEARQMRSDLIAQTLTAGLAGLRNLFSLGHGAPKSA